MLRAEVKALDMGFHASYSLFAEDDPKLHAPHLGLHTTWGSPALKPPQQPPWACDTHASSGWDGTLGHGDHAPTLTPGVLYHLEPLKPPTMPNCLERLLKGKHLRGCPT